MAPQRAVDQYFSEDVLNGFWPKEALLPHLRSTLTQKSDHFYECIRLARGGHMNLRVSPPAGVWAISQVSPPDAWDLRSLLSRSLAMQLLESFQENGVSFRSWTLHLGQTRSARPV